MSQIPSHYIIKEWNQKGSFPSSIRHEMYVLNIYYFIKYLWLLSCHFWNVMWWEHIFCFWWYPRDIKVKMKNRLKNSHNIQKIHRSRTYDERKSSSGTLNDILIGTQCAEFCVFLCNFTYERTLTVKTFFFFYHFPFLLSKYRKPIFDVSLFELKKDIFNVYSIYTYRENLSFRHQMREHEAKREMAFAVSNFYIE